MNRYFRLWISVSLVLASTALADTAVRVSDINPTGSSGPIHPIVPFNGKIYFPATGPSGQELYGYDGVNPPALVDDLVDGPGGSGPDHLVVFDGELYFTAFVGSSRQIYRYNGADPPSPIPAGGSTNAHYPTAFGSVLVFYAESAAGGNLWKFDGTNPATMVHDFGTGNEGLTADPFGVFGSHLVFQVLQDGHIDLWQWDGVNPPSPLPGPASSVTDFSQEFVEVNGVVIWGNSDPGGSGQTVLWRWNGVNAPAVVGNFDIEGGMGYHNGAAYFTALDLTPGNETEREIWRYDGVNPPTRIAPGMTFSITYDFISFNGDLYFMDGVFTGNVWKYDNVNPPVLDPDAWPGQFDYAVRGFGRLGDFLYLSATTAAEGVELWRITPSGGPAGPPPDIAAISPTSGPAAGGTSVTITGADFVTGASVTVGGVSATNVQVTTPGSITAVTAAMAPGVLHAVTVTNPDAQTDVLGTAYLADFLDVPQADFFHDFVETLVRNGVTAGCGGGNYCRNTSVTRGQMAVFLLKAKLGSAYLPPPCTGAVFVDVPCSGGTFDPWIEDLAARGITGGCGGGLYCPNNPITRAQMAVFLLKALEGSAYTPPACDGTVFDDVPCSGGTFDPWIEELASRQITSGCSITPPLYCPGSPNTRGQMAVFLVRAFLTP